MLHETNTAALICQFSHGEGAGWGLRWVVFIPQANKRGLDQEIGLA